MFDIVMMEHALDRHVEGLYGMIAADSRQQSGTRINLLEEWTVPKFKIREMRLVREADGW